MTEGDRGGFERKLMCSYLVDAGNRADLVDLVEEDDAGLGAVHVVVGVLGGRESRVRVRDSPNSNQNNNSALKSPLFTLHHAFM